MKITLARIASLLIAAAYVIGTAIAFGSGGELACCLLLLPPLSLIWFADDISGYTGLAVNENRLSVPARAIAAIGWVFMLIGPFVAIYYLPAP